MFHIGCVEGAESLNGGARQGWRGGLHEHWRSWQGELSGGRSERDAQSVRDAQSALSAQLERC